MPLTPIVDYTYFTGRIFIPGIGTTIPAQIAAKNELDAYILRYEKTFLRKVMGDDMYDDYVVNYANAAYVALVAELRDATNKTSPCADFIWYKYQEDHQTILTPAGGDKKVQAAGMTPLIDAGKYCKIWNEMVDDLEDYFDFIDDNAATYLLFDGVNFEKINPILN